LNGWMRYPDDDEYMKHITISIDDLERDVETDKKIKDYLPMTDKKYINIYVEKSRWITNILTEEELERPIVEYFFDNNIDRACWSFNYATIDINNNFNHYIDCSDPEESIAFFGYTYHTKYKTSECDISKCDLVKCSGSNHIWDCIKPRYGVYHFTIVIDEFISYHELKLATICNKQKIIESFLKDIERASINFKSIEIKSNLRSVEYNLRLTESNIRLIESNLRPNEIDLYHTVREYDEDIDQDIDSKNYKDTVTKIIDSNDFIVDFFCKNENIVPGDAMHIKRRYVIVIKTLRLANFYQMIDKILPDDLSTIVYDYADFETDISTHDFFI